MEGSQPAALRSLPGYAIAQAFRVLRHELDGALRDLGLTAPQVGALVCLAERDGATGAEMARIHHVTPQTMHTILQNLEAAGLIVREPHPEHGTLLCVRLTPEGRDRLAEAATRVREVNERMLKGLDERERAALGQLLFRCIDSLEADGSTEAGIPCLD
jgi:DNA-binding MarR family transcriptional regulator